MIFMAYKPELLSPVGSMEALKAAVQNGADAVYMGGQRFNARQYASNFDDRELAQAIEYAHLRWVRVYITFNILMADEELEQAVKYLEYLYRVGADAVIVQDLAIAALAGEYFPGLQVHASTQMTVYNAEGVLLLRDMGVDRVVAARELSLDEVVELKKLSGITIEVFVQGSLCMSYSGQCLMSSLIGGRSGNRGKCAQPCRKWYGIVERGKEDRVIKEGYLLSPSDLFTLDSMDKLLDAGIDSFKIEGRMKRPEYVAAATGAYRRAIDSYLASGSIGDTDDDRDVLTRVFNRGFTGGYILGGDREDFLSGDRPDNRGVPVGTVVKNAPGRVAIELSDNLTTGDGIEIDLGSEKAGARVSSMAVKGKPVETARRGQVVDIGFKRPASIGSVAYKTYDSQLMAKLARSYTDEHIKVPVYCFASFKRGMVPEVQLWDQGGCFVTVTGERPVEAAAKVPVDEGRIKQQLCKTGGTPYYMEQVSLDIDSGIYVSFSEINSLRRRALEDLSRMRTGIDRPAVDLEEPLKDINERKVRKARDHSEKRLRVTVETGNPELAGLFMQSGADVVMLRCHADRLEEYEDLGEQLPLCIKFPLVTDRDYMRRITGLMDRLRETIRGIEVSNLGQIYACRGFEGNVDIMAGRGLNIFNSLSVAKMKDLGCSGVVLSPELTLKQVRDITEKADAYCEVVAQGRLRLMTIRYPVLDGLKRGRYGFKDKKGYVFPVYEDETGRTEVGNSQPLFMLDRMEELRGTGIGGIRLIHHDEDWKEFAGLVKNYRRAADGKSYDRGLADEYIKRGITRGHFYRGV